MKRMIDIIATSCGLLFILPLLVIIVVVLYFINEGKGKIFFIQERPGKDERIFKILKFKTMNDKTDAEGNLLPDIQRITSFGKFLRKTSLDEIPQLVNVLHGDMSLVGPRPLLIEYLPLYDDIQKLRHSVRPGITGWAQINGRNALTWTQKFRYDVWYVQNLSFGLDMKILFLTMIKVFRQEKVNLSDEKTSKLFNGSN
jgi:lipopolysaccharide/colanic/teichoic acid biosynthesis glycosyltransferase